MQQNRLLSSDSTVPGAQEPRGSTHFFSTHTPLWKHCDRQFARPFGNTPGTAALFDFLPPETTVQDAAAATGLHVFLGARLSPQLIAGLKTHNTLKIIAEPDHRTFSEFLDSAGDLVAERKDILFLLGDFNHYIRPLLRLLPENVTLSGFPVFFLQEKLAENAPEYTQNLIQNLELFHYRHSIIPITDHLSGGGLPFRDYTRDLSFDQQAHAYANISKALTAGVADDLENIFKAETAVLVGAGPDLDNKIETVRRFSQKGVVIAVNNSLKTLVKHGIIPHFLVIFDSRLAIKQGFSDMEPLPDTILVTNPLATSPVWVCPKLCFYNSYLPELFGRRKPLPSHASVLITGFSLAKLLGCSRVVLVGAQFSSPGSNQFEHSKDSVHGENSRATAPTNPRLIPVQTDEGKTYYTLPAYLDAARWFYDEIRESEVEVVNTTRESILFGPPIIIDEGFDFTGNPDIPDRVRAVEIRPREYNTDAIRAYVQKEITRWEAAKHTAEDMLQQIDAGAAEPEPIRRTITVFDEDNITFLLERFEGFQPRLVNEIFETDDPEHILAGGRHYFDHLARMAPFFLTILGNQITKIDEPTK